jgi:glycine dehydrogenase
MNLRRFREWGDTMLGINARRDHHARRHRGAVGNLFAQPGRPCPRWRPSTSRHRQLIPPALRRSSAFLTHPVFNTHHSETEMLRYIRSLSDKDLALDRSMIPLGSCTMKLNATSEMIPITWPEFAHVHPFAPADQLAGYCRAERPAVRLAGQATGYAGISLQPNAGSPGRIRRAAGHPRLARVRGEAHRNICLIPESAHGTNPASAQMVGMTVVVVKCDARATSTWTTCRPSASSTAPTWRRS